MAHPEDSGPISPEVWRIAFVIVFGAFMAGLDTSLVNVGLETIVRTLHGSLASAQWVSNGYLIALAAALPICGWLGRRLGAGRLWRYALAAFTLLSGLCAAAPSLSLLIVFRVLQGVAGGLLVPSGQTIVGRAAGSRHMGAVMNTAGIAVVLAPAVGPALGGLLIAGLSWRWLFLVNLPIGLVVLVVAARILPRDEPADAGPLDAIGLVLLASGLPLVIYGLIQASQQRSLAAPAVLATLPLGVLALAAYLAHALRSRPGRPQLLDLGLFANRTYAAAQLSVFFCGASLYGGLIVLPLYYQILRGRDVKQTGLLLLAYGAGSVMSLRLGGVLTDRMGGGLTAVLGLGITILATLPFTILDAHASLLLVETLQLLRGVGVSFAGLPVMSSAYAVVHRESLPDATVQASILQRIGGSLGGAFFIVVLERHHPIDLAAFHHVFAWLTSTAALALVTAGWLTVEQRNRQARHPS